MSDFEFHFNVTVDGDPEPYPVTAGYSEVVRLEQHFDVSILALFAGVDPDAAAAADGVMPDVGGLRMTHLAFLAWSALRKAVRRGDFPGRDLDQGNRIATFDQFLDLLDAVDQVDDEATPDPEGAAGSSG